MDKIEETKKPERGKEKIEEDTFEKREILRVRRSSFSSGEQLTNCELFTHDLPIYIIYI